MNKLTIIGNLTRDPELRTTRDGLDVCTFSVAVNRPKKKADGTTEADFFRCTAWRQLAVNCGKYLAKGRKVAVCGPVSLNTYTTQDGRSGATLEVTADDVEFLTPRDTVAYQETMPQATPAAAPAPQIDPQSGMQQVSMDDDELPF